LDVGIVSTLDRLLQRSMILSHFAPGRVAIASDGGMKRHDDI